MHSTCELSPAMEVPLRAHHCEKACADLTSRARYAGESRSRCRSTGGSRDGSLALSTLMSRMQSAAPLHRQDLMKAVLKFSGTAGGSDDAAAAGPGSAGAGRGPGCGYDDLEGLQARA
eukprot:16436701-Heterocapsa_arctica.AAC.1